jgi:hypothetical protein
MIFYAVIVTIIIAVVVTILIGRAAEKAQVKGRKILDEV